MENNLYKQMEEQVEDKHRKALLRADIERKEGLRAAENFCRILKGDVTEIVQNNSKPPIKSNRRTKNHVNGYGSFISTTKSIISQIQGRFTKNDVMKAVSNALGREVPYNSLDGCLRRLKQQKIIEIVVKGKGRKPNKYKKIEKQNDGFF